jgi:hypothetical protein
LLASKAKCGNRKHQKQGAFTDHVRL